MKSRLWKLLCGLGIFVIAGAMILLSGHTTMARAASSDDGFLAGGELQGTWNVKIAQVNCETGAALGPAFSSLLSFAAGGTVTEETVNPGFAIGQRSVGLGNWSREGRHSYKAKSIAFIAFTTPPNLPASPGFTAGTQTIAQTIEFKDGPDEFTSEAAVEFADTTGAVYRSGCATATGWRFQ